MFIIANRCIFINASEIGELSNLILGHMNCPFQVFILLSVWYIYINIKIMSYINVQTDAIIYLLLAFPLRIPRIVLSKYT